MPLYRQRARIVEAYQVWDWTAIAAPNGRTDYAQPGDYVVTTRSGEQFAFRPEAFHANFEAATACEPLRSDRRRSA